MKQNSVIISNFEVSNNHPFFLIAGPCAIEGRNHALDHAGLIKEICNNLKINFVYKSSFDKANRSSTSSIRGVGIDKGLDILLDVKNTYKVPVITDVHESYQCIEVANVVDIIQIPAFLSRQTDLLIAAGKTKKVVNIKKGQFLAPWDMFNVINKIKSTGNTNVLLTERGTSFGYNTLVNDFKGIDIMKKYKYPVIFDATHSVQQPGGMGDKSGGQREHIPSLCKAAISIGVAGLFLETHNDPDNAPSDGPNMINIKDLKNLLIQLKQFDDIAKNHA